MLATRNFLQNEKLLFLAKVIALSNLENTANYSTSANFNRNSPKINFKIYLPRVGRDCWILPELGKLPQKTSQKFPILNFEITHFLYYIQVLFIHKNVEKKIGNIASKNASSYLNSSQNFPKLHNCHPPPPPVHYVN